MPEQRRRYDKRHLYVDHTINLETGEDNRDYHVYDRGIARTVTGNFPTLQEAWDAADAYWAELLAARKKGKVE